jgi:predicted TIM-barrel fold metal-dependent hydrolase
MAKLDYLPIDADNHYYEPHDCCSRHLERKYIDEGRVCHVAKNDDGVEEWCFGDRPLSFHRATRDLVLPPGAYRPFMSEKAKDQDPGPPPKLQSSNIPQFRDKDARIRTLDKQGIEATIMLPSFGIAFETDCLDDPEAMLANMRAFNRFVEDDWGYHHQGRIFAFPHLSLVDLDWAIEELERVLSLGARGLILRAGPVVGRSPADPHFDPFWARVEEAGIVTAVHIGVSGYNDWFGAAWGEKPRASEQTMSPFQYLTCFGTRPIMDTMAAFVLHGLYERFPALKVASIENGSAWVPGLLQALDKLAAISITSQGASKTGRPMELPSEIFRRNVWVAPFFEDDVPGLVNLLGAENVLFGSDWPHPEGVAAPIDFLEEVEMLPEDQIRLIMRDNTAGLLGIKEFRR